MIAPCSQPAFAAQRFVEKLWLLGLIEYYTYRHISKKLDIADILTPYP